MYTWTCARGYIVTECLLHDMGSDGRWWAVMGDDGQWRADVWSMKGSDYGAEGMDLDTLTYSYFNNYVVSQDTQIDLNVILKVQVMSF